MKRLTILLSPICGMQSTLSSAAAAIASKNVPKIEAADSVNHKFESAACQDALWESLCHKEFGVAFENVGQYWPMDQMGWKECYQKLSFFAIKIEFSKGPLAGDVRILRPTQESSAALGATFSAFCSTMLCRTNTLAFASAITVSGSKTSGRATVHGYDISACRTMLMFVYNPVILLNSARAVSVSLGKAPAPISH